MVSAPAKSPRSESETFLQIAAQRRECKAELIKTIVSDLYSKQAEILRLKNEIDMEYIVHESAGGASGVDTRSLEKVNP